MDPGLRACEEIGWLVSWTVAYPSFVLRQAQHEDRFFVASPNKTNLMLSLSKDERPRQRLAI
jgi:hypothetical protein